MSNQFSILFYAKKAKKTKTGLIPVYLRITIDGKRFEISTNRYIEESKWSTSAGRMRGSHEEAKSFNVYLDTLRTKSYAVQTQIEKEYLPFTIENFRNFWLGENQPKRMLLQLFQQHNEEVEKLVGIDFAPGTLERYRTSLQHTRSFIQWKYGWDDIDIKNINYEFISQYSTWLKTTRHCNHNSTVKYLGNFKKIIILCRKNGWLQQDPFIHFKMSKKEVVRDCLNAEELKIIYHKTITAERLCNVRDIFIFCCFTGLAYADVYKLKKSEIVDNGKEKWINTRRKKTDSSTRVPLLPIPLEIIMKYENHPLVRDYDRVLPVTSNQKMNAYLKEIADICNIRKNLTFHIARHTFATTVTLNNGVPIESVSKMLGHKNLRTTQHYAKIIDRKLGEDMNKLKSFLKM